MYLVVHDLAIARRLNIATADEALVEALPDGGNVLGIEDGFLGEATSLSGAGVKGTAIK